MAAKTLTRPSPSLRWTSVDLMCTALSAPLDGGCVTVRVSGELDLSAAPQLAATVEELLAVGFAHILIDLRDLRFLDSAGVHTLVAAQHGADAHGAALSLVKGPGDVHRVLELTATDALFNFAQRGVDG
jgi:anti-anti-sigma factor